jgi:hypothetical protein
MVGEYGFFFGCGFIMWERRDLRDRCSILEVYFARVSWFNFASGRKLIDVTMVGIIGRRWRIIMQIKTRACITLTLGID